MSSAGSTSASTNFTEPTKSSRLNVLAIASPSRSHPSSSSRREEIWSSSRRSTAGSIEFVPMRIASLVPSATEMLFALGAGDSVVAVTHECDFPPQAEARARLTRSVIPDGLAPGEIDAAVREVTAQGRALYELDEGRLARLEVDLIVTQALCAVCAVSYDDVRAVAERLPTTPRVISLDPGTLAEVLGDVATLGAQTGLESEARELRASLDERLAAVRAAVDGAPHPRVAALEWLDP